MNYQKLAGQKSPYTPYTYLNWTLSYGHGQLKVNIYMAKMAIFALFWSFRGRNPSDRPDFFSKKSLARIAKDPKRANKIL